MESPEPGPPRGPRLSAPAEPTPFVRLRARVLFALVCAWLLWRGGAAVVARVQELAATDRGEILSALAASEDERLARTLAEQDRLQRLPRGYHFELYRALHEHLPAGGTVYVRQQPGRMAWPKGRSMPALHHLIVPAAFRPSPYEYGMTPLDEDASVVLDFDDELRSHLEARRSPVARGADWTLWQ